MPSQVFFPEYPDERRTAAPYPFADGVSLAAVTGLRIPEGLFVDASIYIRGAAPPIGVRVIEVAADSVTVWIGGGGLQRGASCVFDPRGPVVAPRLEPRPGGRAAGVLVLDTGRLPGISAWPLGVHEFAPGAADFAARCVVPVPDEAVTGIRVGEEVLSGKVWLVGGPGVIVRSDRERSFRVDAVGDPLFLRRSCSGDDQEGSRRFVTPNFVRMIRVVNPDGESFEVTPDPYGEISIIPVPWAAPDTTLRIRPDGDDGVRFESAGYSAR